jgi:hypothetical protein
VWMCVQFQGGVLKQCDSFGFLLRVWCRCVWEYSCYTPHTCMRIIPLPSDQKGMLCPYTNLCIYRYFVCIWGVSTCHLVTFMTKHVYGKNHHIMIDYDVNRGGTTKEMKNKWFLNMEKKEFYMYINITV